MTGGGYDANNRIENTRPILKGRTRFFVVKSFSQDSINLSIENEVWSTSAGPTKKITNAFKTVDNVVLIFSVNESRSFQGFAVVQSEPDPNYRHGLFISDSVTPISFADNFKIKWILSCQIPFTQLGYLPMNPMNDNMPIKQSKNG